MSQTLDLKAPVGAMSAHYRGGERYDIAVRGHTVTVDQPAQGGGEDAAPTPTELFVASLAGGLSGNGVLGPALWRLGPDTGVVMAFPVLGCAAGQAKTK